MAHRVREGETCPAGLGMHALGVGWVRSG